ncbi:TetR/AcrR family transcriptional regulator [Nonomuraea sediminis]|uniref:TetR/AcrR family transcriptional regulator n=1 Tax=Nonomuraea sediminis TaxID=2835864 RepID=UPI001BDC31D8|nr:TetR/AcrR family transcriptional regulator [Nonomuraea sediminis]
MSRSGRRGEILETFIRHVAERGYERTNLGDIADELGLSKGTIVHHFGTKAGMLRELEEGFARRQLEAVALMWQRLPAPHERLAAVIHAFVIVHTLAGPATVASQREVGQLAAEPELGAARRLRRQVRDLVAAEVRRGIELGVFRQVDAELATLQLFGSLQWMWVWYDAAGPRTPEEVGAGFVDVFLGGLLLDRLCLRQWADPGANLVPVVWECLRAVSA